MSQTENTLSSIPELVSQMNAIETELEEYRQKNIEFTEDWISKDPKNRHDMDSDLDKEPEEISYKNAVKDLCKKYKVLVDKVYEISISYIPPIVFKKFVYLDSLSQLQDSSLGYPSYYNGDYVCFNKLFHQRYKLDSRLATYSLFKSAFEVSDSDSDD